MNNNNNNNGAKLSQSFSGLNQGFNNNNNNNNSQQSPSSLTSPLGMNAQNSLVNSLGGLNLGNSNSDSIMSDLTNSTKLLKLLDQQQTKYGASSNNNNLLNRQASLQPTKQNNNAFFGGGSSNNQQNQWSFATTVRRSYHSFHTWSTMERWSIYG
jgi:hypothetical protein